MTGAKTLCNQCVLRTMIYGVKLWTLTKKTVHRIRVAQRGVERAMLGITLPDRIRTKVQHVGDRVIDPKWSEQDTWLDEVMVPGVEKGKPKKFGSSKSAPARRY